MKTISQLSGRGTAQSTPLATIRNTLRTRGIVGFYSGCGPVVIGNALKAGTRFFTYETIRDALRGPDRKLSTFKNVMAGMGAGCVESMVAVTPSEVIKLEHV